MRFLLPLTAAFAGAVSAVASDGLNLQLFEGRELRGAELMTATGVFPLLSGPAYADGPAVEFSARWLGSVKFPAAGQWKLFTVSDDGVRVWLDGALAIDQWTDHPPQVDVATVIAPGVGSTVSLRMEYFQGGGGSTMRLEWEGPGRSREVVPLSALSTNYGQTPLDGTGFSAMYFHNTQLLGTPVTTRVRAVDFNWNGQSPVDGIDGQGFSARYLGRLTPPASGSWTISARSDDGIRVWIDGRLIIDAWKSQAVTTYTATIDLIKDRPYTVRVDYMQTGGLSVAELSWQGPGQPLAAIAGFVKPVGDLVVAWPDSSPTSPVCLEALSASGAKIEMHAKSVKQKGRKDKPTTRVNNSASLSPLGDGTAYANVPLDPQVPTQVKLSSGLGVESHAIVWQKTVLDGRRGETVHVRVGDSLLISTKGRDINVAGYGGGTTYAGSADGTPVTFALPDEYVVSALDAAGNQLGSIRVVAVSVSVSADGVDQDTVFALEVGYSNKVPFKVSPDYAIDALTLSPSASLTVSLERTASDVAATVRPVMRGFGTVSARLGNGGPILAAGKVQPFELNRSALSTAYAFAKEGNNLLAESFLEVRPFVPNLEFDFSMFATGSRFVGGATSFKLKATDPVSSIGEPGFILSTDPSTGESVGRFRYVMAMPPGEDDYCHKLETFANY